MSGMLPRDKSAILNMNFSDREQAIQQELSENTDHSLDEEFINYAREIQQKIIDANLPAVEEFVSNNELRETLLEHLKVEQYDDPISCELSHRVIEAFVTQQIAILQAAENFEEFELATKQVMEPYLQYEKQFEPSEESKKLQLEPKTIEEINRVRERYKIIMHHIYLAKILCSLNFSENLPDFINIATSAYKYFFPLEKTEIMVLLGNSKYSHFKVANAIITPLLENFKENSLSEILANINLIITNVKEMPIDSSGLKKFFINELRDQLYSSFTRLINNEKINDYLSDGDYVALLQLVKMSKHINDPDIRSELYDIIEKFCTGIIEKFPAEVDGWEEEDLEILHSNLANILTDINSISEDYDNYYENREAIFETISKVIIASVREQTNEFLIPKISIPHALSYDNEEAKTIINEMMTFINTVSDNYLKIINDPDDLQELRQLLESIFEPTIEYLREKSLEFSSPNEVIRFNNETIENIREFIAKYSPMPDDDNIFSQLKLTSYIKILQNLLYCFNSMANKKEEQQITLLEHMLLTLQRIKPKRRSSTTTTLRL